MVCVRNGYAVYESPFIDGTPFALPSSNDIATTSNAIGFRLPPSYVEFCAKYGRGAIDNLVTIWVPTIAVPDNLAAMMPVAREQLLVDIHDGFAEYPPDADEAIAARLVPFGNSSNAHVFAWDLGDIRSGEPAVFSIGRASLSFVRVGHGVDTFIHSILTDDVRRSLGSGYSPLRGCFKPSPIPLRET